MSDPIALLDVRPPRDVVIRNATVLHLAWVTRLETAFEQVVIRSLKRAVRPVTAALGALTAQGEPADAPTPGGEAFVSADDLAQIRSLWIAQVTEELVPLLAEVYGTGAQGVALSVAGIADVTSVTSVGAQEWLNGAQNRLARIGDTAWLGARDELREGFQRGESIDELAKRVRGVIEVTDARARTIARTEVIGASNAGAFAEARARGLATKTWLNTDDARTRPTHVAAGEQTVSLDDAFIVGGSRLRFPHDPQGPLGETINCRCTLLFDEQPLCVCTPSWVKKETGLVAAGPSDCGCSSDTLTSSARIEAFPIRHDPHSGRFLPEGTGGAPGPALPPDPDHYSAKQAQAFIDEGWSGWRGDVSTGQRHMVEDYASDTKFVHYNMNAYLRGTPRRGGGKPPTKSMVGHKVKQLDGAFEHESARTPHDVTVHRGLHGELGSILHSANERGTLVGGTLRDPGFMSTSLDRRVARRFSTGEGAAGRGEKVLFNIHLKKGDRAVAPGKFARRHSKEAEVILPRNQTFTVTGARKRGGVLEVDLEMKRG